MPGHRPRCLDLTEAHVARVERLEPDSGPEPGLSEMTDDDMDRLARRFVAEAGARPLWVFAYGSLIWKPAFEHVEQRLGVVHGWRRSFCLDIVRWRATPEEPGLMLALDRGGACRGVAYRLPEGNRHAQMLQLLKRETAYHEDIRSVRWVTCRSEGGAFPALTFYAASPGDPYYLRLPLEVQARRLARAAGHIGSGAMYLWNTVRHLEEMGIRDSYLWRLQKLVADEIAALPPEFPPRRQQ